MVVPYGFGVGDFLAISKLIYKIGLELKKNPKSTPDYQHLLIELEALDRALKLLQCIKPRQHELRRLDGIRALASTCQRPLEEFLAKIEKFEEHLGSWNASDHQFSGLTRRLQWSIKYKEEVKSLRAKLAPNVATITVLLVTQTIDTLSNAESDRLQIARELNYKLSSQSKILADLKQTTLGITTAQARLQAEQSHMTAAATAQDQDQDLRTLKSKADELLKGNITHDIHLHNQDAILVDIQDNGTTINSRTQETHILATATRQDIAEIKVATDSILRQALDLMSAVTTGIAKIQDIITLIAQMIRLTTQFTIDMRETMGNMLRVFWDIQRQLARLDRFLPKQIDLPIVRFRDAFNEMRSLPYDLSRQWQTFQGLVAVIFTNRQGLHRVNMGQYFVTDVRIGQRLNPAFWSNAIEPGDELSMTMILDDIEAEDGFCPYKSCGASTKDVASRRGGKTCPNCYRFAAISQRKEVPRRRKRHKHGLFKSYHEHPTPESDPESSLDDYEESEEFEADAVSVHAPELEAPEKEDIELYHSIQVVQALLASACDETGSSERKNIFNSITAKWPTDTDIGLPESMDETTIEIGETTPAQAHTPPPKPQALPLQVPTTPTQTSPPPKPTPKSSVKAVPVGPLPRGWFQASDNGKTYYYSADGQTTWTRPIQPIAQPPPPKPTPKSGVMAMPTLRDHTSDQLGPEGDEYIPREFDEAGEKKVDALGYPQDGRQYRCRTFIVSGRGEKLFMLATECTRVLNYRDSYLLFNKNRSLYKIIATQKEKEDLIEQEILPFSYRSRQIAIVTARSVFRQFGSRVIVGGRRVRDDYWEGKARKQGFTEDDPAGEKQPGASRAREVAVAETPG